MPRATRRNIASGSPWEPVVGYSRAVRVATLVADAREVLVRVLKRHEFVRDEMIRAHPTGGR